MSFVYEERPSTSPLVEAVWRTEDTSTGTYLAAADGAWDMIFITQNSQTKVLLSGPSSHAKPVRYKIGNRNLGIRFHPGVFFPTLPANSMLDVTNILPAASPQAFWFDQQAWELPTFDNADDFLHKLEDIGLVTKDPLIQSVLHGESPAVTLRSVQRRFLHATGLPPRYHEHIKRASRAVELLEKDQPIMDVVHRLGYADQAHMTRIIKRLSGCTPGQIVKKVKHARRLHSINGYGACGQMKVLNFNGGLHADQTVQNQHSPGAA